MKNKSLILILLALTMFANPCQMGSAAEFIDQAGRKTTLPLPPLRVVSLAPSLTEIVYQLGQEKKLVGATLFSNYPDAAKRLPRVGSYVRLDLERIIALRPDLCLAIKDGNPPHTLQHLLDLKIPVYSVDPRNLDQTMAAIAGIGAALDAKKDAEILIRNMKERIRNVKKRLAHVITKPKVFFQIDAELLVSAGKNTFINELIGLAGGLNLAADGNDYPRYNWEEIMMMQPDVVLISAMTGSHTPRDLRVAWQRWPNLPAVKTNRIHVVDPDLFNRPTKRLVDGLETLAAILHPKLVTRNP